MTVQRPILDLRPEQDFLQGHLKGSVNVPFELLEQCWHELPPKGTNLHIITADNALDTAQQFLEQHGYPIAMATRCSQLTQNVEPLEQGSSTHRLWNPNPLLEQSIALIQQHYPAPNAVLDIGCGAGRDAVFLAQKGYQVIAIDNHQRSLQRLELFAKRSQVAIKTNLLDCEHNLENVAQLWQTQQPCMIVQSRYLHRPLLDAYQQLPTGSIILVHTFLEGAAKFGSPKKPQYLLKDNELAERFSAWRILLDDIHHLEDGRPLSLFIAQK